MANYFAGHYLKHQKEDHTLAIIVGKASSGDFLQIITNQQVFQYHNLKNCRITRQGLSIHYPEVKGRIHYGPFLPLRYSIMGPFQYLPMQCNHKVISMKHTLRGSVLINGETISFDGGMGYIEGDYGRSFPKEYLWLQCNDFLEDLSIMVSIAHIPFLGLHFTGCICAITYKGREYRLGTYKGVKVILRSKTRLILSQGDYLLDIRLSPHLSHPLRSPKKGHMVGIIHESNCTKAIFQFYKKRKLIFKAKTHNCSYEYNYLKSFLSL